MFATAPSRPAAANHEVDKYFPIPSLLITTTVVCALLPIHITEWRGPERLANFVETQRIAIAIIVQVLSHGLGLLQVQSLCCVLRCAFSHAASRTSFSLRNAQFVHAASTPRVSWSLPWFLSLPLLLVVAFSVIPAAVWSAALTPNSAERISAETISISTYTTPNVSDMFVPPASVDQLTHQGLFSFDPSALRGVILSSASDASTTNATGSVHLKLDKTGYSYINRSYGAGSAAGLTGASDNNALWYNYNETGFVSTASCKHNQSDTLVLFDESDGGIVINQLGGELANGRATGGWTYVGYTSPDILAWANDFDNRTNTMYLSITTRATRENDPWNFVDFNTTQCQIKFTPTQFQILVNTTVKQITVTPESTVEWPEYTIPVLDQVSLWMWVFSYVDNGFGGSTVGRSMRVNADQMLNSGKPRNNDTVLRSVEDFLESCIDNTLVSLASARLIMKNATMPVDSLTGTHAVTIGDYRFIFVMFVFNALICIAYIEEAVRTSFWNCMSPLDLMDLSSVIVGALRGGVAFAGGSPDTIYESQQRYMGEDKLLLVRKLKVRLTEHDSAFPSIVPSDSEAVPYDTMELSLLPIREGASTVDVAKSQESLGEDKWSTQIEINQFEDRIRPFYNISSRR